MALQFAMLLVFTLPAGCVCAIYALQATPAPPAKQSVEENTGLPMRMNEVAPVAPFHQPIFSIYSKLGPLTPAERAERLERMVRQLGKVPDFSPGKMRIVSDGATLDIIYGDMVVMSVSDGDAEHFQTSKEEVVEYYKANIAAAIDQHKLDTDLMAILSRSGMVLLVLSVFFFIIRYINALHRFARRKVDALQGTLIRDVRIKSYILLDENRCVTTILFLIRIVKYLILLPILYFSVTLLFSIFPETRGLADMLLEYVLTPFSDVVIGIRGYLPKAFTIAVIVTIFWYLAKSIRYFAGEIEKEKLVIRGFYPDWAKPTAHIIQALMCAFMFIVIFQHLPYSDSKIFQGVSVFIGLLISIGSTALIGNLISGMVLTYMRPFCVGDFVKIGEILGTVKEKKPFAIRVVTPKNEEIIIPNSTIMSAHTINYSHSARNRKLILHVSITSGYDTPWRQIHELLLSAAARTRHSLANPPPFILQRALNSDFAEYQINIHVAEEKLMPQIYSELYENVQDVFLEAGIDMTCPTYQNIRNE